MCAGQRTNVRVSFLLLPCKFKTSNSDRQAWWRMPFTLEPSYQLLFPFQMSKD